MLARATQPRRGAPPAAALTEAAVARRQGAPLVPVAVARRQGAPLVPVAAAPAGTAQSRGSGSATPCTRRKRSTPGRRALRSTGASPARGRATWTARTILAQGDELEPQAYDRLREGYAHHGYRVLAYLNTGTIPAPATIQGDGGGALRQGWLGACKIFGSDTPPDVATLCGRDEVTGFAPAGANHLVAEPFVDER